jgi:hypothetical protein
MNKRKNKRPKAKKRSGHSTTVKDKKPEYKQARTPNGQRIQRLLVRTGWPPSQYKDYVVVFGTTLLDWKDRYTVTTTDGKPVGSGEMMLVHKSKLHGMIPRRIADRFWHQATGTRVVKAGPR